LISKTAVHAEPVIKQLTAWYIKRCKKIVKTKVNAINIFETKMSYRSQWWGIKEIGQIKLRDHTNCPGIGKTAAHPLVMNSTAMDKIIKPNTRVTTFITVVPNRSATFSAITNITALPKKP